MVIIATSAAIINQVIIKVILLANIIIIANYFITEYSIATNIIFRINFYSKTSFTFNFFVKYSALTGSRAAKRIRIKDVQVFAFY
jgi:hypothetical protein